MRFQIEWWGSEQQMTANVKTVSRNENRCAILEVNFSDIRVLTQHLTPLCFPWKGTVCVGVLTCRYTVKYSGV